MFLVKQVVGGAPGATEYDETRVDRYDDANLAIMGALARQPRATYDVLDESDQRVARVHVDGGVDRYGVTA